MTDRPSYPDPDATEPTTGASTSTPRWVKLSVLIALAVVVVVVIVMLVSGGEHGPGRHSGGDAPPSSVAEQHVAPAGHLPQ
jgi:hypothetical protein